jgi:hypothetical protein
MPEIVVGRDDEDLKKYGTKGTLFIGKHMVGTGEDAHLTTPVLLDAVRPHVITLTGKRGSGKSFSLGVIAEEILKLEPKIRQNLCVLIIDTQGIFWTMKFANEKQLTLLSEWGLKSQGFDIRVYVPFGQVKTFSDAAVDYDGVFSFSAAELTAEDWLNVFELNPNKLLGVLTQKVINRLLEEGKDYTIDDIVKYIRREEGFGDEKMALENRFQAAKTWGIFGEARMPKILEPGKATVLDVSLTPQNVRSLLVGLVTRKILAERIKARRKEESAEMEMSSIKHVPMCWILIDEAHNFIPAEGRTASSDILNRVVKEGRQPGVSTVFATQRPNKLHPDVLAQCDMVISHRLTSKADIEALSSIMQTYLMKDIGKFLGELPKLKGTAVILDDNSERLYKIRVRPRQSWHAGASPTAV